MRSLVRPWGIAAVLALLAGVLCVLATGVPSGHARATVGRSDPDEVPEIRPDSHVDPAVASPPNAEGDDPRGDVDPPSDSRRLVEVVFEGVTEAWRGREVVLYLWGGSDDARERVRVEANRSVLCYVPSGGWNLDLHDDMNRSLWGPTLRQEVAPSDTTIRICLPKGCRVQGTIATADRLPFVGNAYFGDVDHDVTTDARGAFDAGFLAEGTHAVDVLCRTGFVTVGSIEVGGEGTMRVHIGIRGSGSFGGEFLYEPVEGTDMAVKVLRAGEKEPVARIYPDGRAFEMNHLEPGSYVLRSISLPAPVTFSILEGQRTDLGKIPVLPNAEWRWSDDLNRASDDSPSEPGG